MIKWTPEKIDKLKEKYSISSDKQLAEYFPDCNIKTVRIKARKMGLQRIPSYYEPVLPNLCESEIAYLAGLFDGEGCIHIAKNKPRPKGKNPYHKLMICIANTNKEIINYLYNTFGGRVNNNIPRKNEQPCQSWFFYSQYAKVFLKMIFPFLRIKRKQAKIAIVFQDSIKYGCTELTEEILQKRENFRQSLIELKGAHNRL